MIVLISGFAMSASLCHMQPPFRPHPMQQGPRSNVHQSDAGPPFVEPATLKVPPSRCVERNHVYTLRSWISDLIYFVGRCFRFRSNPSGSSGGIAGARRSKRIDKGVDAPPAAAWRCGSSRWTAIDWSHAVGVSSCAPICSSGSRKYHQVHSRVFILSTSTWGGDRYCLSTF